MRIRWRASSRPWCVAVARSAQGEATAHSRGPGDERGGAPCCQGVGARWAEPRLGTNACVMSSWRVVTGNAAVWMTAWRIAATGWQQISGAPGRVERGRGSDGFPVAYLRPQRAASECAGTSTMRRNWRPRQLRRTHRCQVQVGQGGRRETDSTKRLDASVRAERHGGTVLIGGRRVHGVCIIALCSYLLG